MYVGTGRALSVLRRALSVVVTERPFSFTNLLHFGIKIQIPRSIFHNSCTKSIN
jgi:hypothetical protein